MEHMTLNVHNQIHVQFKRKTSTQKPQKHDIKQIDIYYRYSETSLNLLETNFFYQKKQV